MKKKNVFYLFLIITAVSFVLTMIFNFSKLSPKMYFPPAYNIMNVFMKVDENVDNAFILKKNNEYIGLKKHKKNQINQTLYGKVSSLELFVKENNEEAIKEIVVYNDVKTYYYKGLDEFIEMETLEQCSKEGCSNYTRYLFPNEIKYNKNSDSVNFHTRQNAVCFLLFSIFSFQSVFIIPYILLFITVIYYINNQKEIKPPKINEKFLLVFLLILSAVIFSNDLLTYLPWGDELWSMFYSDPSKKFMTIFEDPGNPPMFYLILRGYLSIVGIHNMFLIKLLPFTFCVLSIFSIYFVLKKMFNTKAALIGAFLLIFNTTTIFYIQGLRGYIIQVFLTPVFVYLLFKIFEENKKRYYIIYGILVGIACNLHYYEVLFVFANWLFAMIYLLPKKRFKDFLFFTLANFIGGLSLVPFFIITAVGKALGDTHFNTWIPVCDFKQIKLCIEYLFRGELSFILFLIFSFVAIIGKEKDKRQIFIIYSLFSIFIVFLMGIILSYAIRPMLVERYIILLVPVFMMALAVIFTSKYNKKYIALLFIIWIFCMQSHPLAKYDHNKKTPEMVLMYLNKYFELKDNNKNVYVILNGPTREYLNYNGKKILDKVTLFYNTRLTVESDIKKVLEKDKNAVIVTNALESSFKNSKIEDKRYTCYFNSSADLCLWKIENED